MPLRQRILTGGGLWLPSTSSQCVWWYRANDLSAGDVTTWSNKISGSSFGDLTDGGVSARRPECLAAAVNGLKAVQFDGTQEVLTSDTGTSVAQDYHVFMVFTVDTWAAARVPLNLNAVASTTYLIMPTGQTDKLIMTSDGGSNNIQHSSDWTPSTYYLAHCVFDGASSGFAQDNNAEEAGNAGTGAMDKVTMGAMASANAHCAVTIAEAFGFNAEQTGGALSTALNYISREYALF